MHRTRDPFARYLLLMAALWVIGCLLVGGMP
jgi:hypothetical protein